MMDAFLFMDRPFPKEQARNTVISDDGHDGLLLLVKVYVHKPS
jgi:hypothetical protein